MDKKDARKMDRFTQFAVAASIMAVKDLALKLTRRIQIVLVFGLVQELGEWKHLKPNTKIF